ncbi:hypothetical protein AC249_AIPGENE13501 [Exaiptasia diaphana]|nr:hypothetical protein AC249_AIPGENE13501 [Exaiptasia diaphana]
MPKWKWCITNLSGDSGELSIDKEYLSRASNCSWTIGKGRSDIDFIVIKFEPFDLGNHCFEDQYLYVEVSDVNHEFKVKECGWARSFGVVIKRRSAVVRYYSEIGYLYHMHCGRYQCSDNNQNIRLSFHVISKKLAGSSAKNWKPTVKQSKPGVVTINWDHSTLPSKNYIVIPLYDDFTTSGEALMYTIEHRNDHSVAVEYLKPESSYSFKVIAFDSTNTRGTFIESTTSSIIMNNGT